MELQPVTTVGWSRGSTTSRNDRYPCTAMVDNIRLTVAVRYDGLLAFAELADRIRC